MSNDFYIIIPSRISSTRLKNKPLVNLNGKTLIQRVFSNALEITPNSYVATDSIEIKNNIVHISPNIVMTSDTHISGTDRIFEAANFLNITDNSLIINLQGDEPFIPKDLIKQLIDDYSKKKCDVITCSKKVNKEKDINDPNCVLVETNDKNYATKFIREGIIENPKRHIGIYGYSFKTLSELISLKPTSNELLYKLEQLRFLENNYSIYVSEYNKEIPAGIDTEEDLDNANKYLKSL
tara:strand:- start:2037 stop:2750 length:714 start_codon:yes stop_codon:yes gene_type:complete